MTLNNKKQTIFSFDYRTALDRSDFIVGISNYEVVKWIDLWPKWKEDALIVIGPKGSGKSHLTSVWREKSNCKILDLKNVNEYNLDIRNIKNIAIENFELCKDFEPILHIVNYIKEAGGKVLITTSKLPSRINIRPLDLLSRVLTYPHAEMKHPSDDVLRGLLYKLFSDRGIKVDKLVINYILLRIERTYTSIKEIVNYLDKKALIENRSITIPFVKEQMENIIN